ncbi:hypothetical protein ACJ41O_013519 [Fusarium nematophilum]
MRTLALVTASLGLLSPAASILVADDSPCGTLCGNVLSATTSDDIVCNEGDYTSGAGIVYQQCLACQQTSDYRTSDNETDQQYLLCEKACGPFRNAIVYKNLSSKVESYEYCDDWPVDDNLDFQGCTECLQIGEQHYLANFITVLQAGCEQQPVPGATVSVEGNVFSKDDVNVTDPSPLATLDPDWFDNGPLNLEAKVGIAAGGVVLILITLGFCIIWRGRRRRRAFLSTLEIKQGGKSWPTPIMIPGEMRETPLSQKPLRGWDESPMSVRSEKPFHNYVSPYASQFSSPVSATELKLANWPVMAPNGQMYQQQQNQSSPHIGVALGGDDSSINTSGSSKGKGRQHEEEYEMRPVDNAHGGIGIYQPEIYQYGESSRAPGPPQGYFPDGLVYPHSTHAHGYYEEDTRRGRSP